MKVMGMGAIPIKTRSYHVEAISNVLHVPDLKSNLLSFGQLEEKEYTCIMKNGVCEVYDLKKCQIAHDKRTSNILYLLQIKNVHSCYYLKLKILHDFGILAMVI